MRGAGRPRRPEVDVRSVRAPVHPEPGPGQVEPQRHVGGHHVERVDGRLLSIGPAQGNHPEPSAREAHEDGDGIVEVRRPGGCRGQEPAGRRRLHLRDRAGDGPLQVDVVACELEEDAAARPRVLEPRPRAAALGRAQAPAHEQPGRRIGPARRGRDRARRGCATGSRPRTGRRSTRHAETMASPSASHPGERLLEVHGGCRARARPGRGAR